MKIELEIWRGAEYRALSAFLSALADAYDDLPGKSLTGLADSDTIETTGFTTEEVALMDASMLKPSQTVASSVPDAGRRERGKPAPGRARRTKEEIAEDDAADKGEAAASVQGISTGENRVAPEDSPEDQQQDAEDEAAEVEQGAPLTVDDLRAALTEYANKFSMEQTQADGAAIFVAAIGNPPAGDEGWKASKVPAELMAQAVKAWRDAAAKSEPFGKRV